MVTITPAHVVGVIHALEGNLKLNDFYDPILISFGMLFGKQMGSLQVKIIIDKKFSKSEIALDKILKF